MLTTNEAADRLGITARSVARLIRDKAISATWSQHARRYEIAEGEIERYKVERRDPGRPKGGAPMTYVKCSTCGKSEEIGKAHRDGWIVAQRKGASEGHLVIRCPEHATAYAKRQAVK